MADTIKRLSLDLVGLSTEAQLIITRDDGSTARVRVDLAGAELTALLAVAATKLAALPPPPTAQERAAARAAADARRAALFAEAAARRNG